MAGFFYDIGTSVISAGIGGGIVYAFTTAKNNLANRRIHRKFRIAGEYMTEFEDEADGHKITRKAPATLLQKGTKITGETNLGKRIWKLNGELDQTGYLYGIYIPENVQDHGKGNFFLRIEVDDKLRGFWSGYDSVNESIVAGAYRFYRLKPFKIVKLEKQFVPALIRIAEKQLGDSYVSEAGLTDSAVKTLVALDSSDVPIGFCTSRILDMKAASEKVPSQYRPKHFLSASRIGLLAVMAVDPAFTGNGAGTAVLRESMTSLSQQGVDLLMLTAWKSSKGENAGNIVERLGFDRVVEMPRYWEKSSVECGYKCPECGDPPCKCSAVLYTRAPVVSH